MHRERKSEREKVRERERESIRSYNRLPTSLSSKPILHDPFQTRKDPDKKRKRGTLLQQPLQTQPSQKTTRVPQAHTQTNKCQTHHLPKCQNTTETKPTNFFRVCPFFIFSIHPYMHAHNANLASPPSNAKPLIFFLSFAPKHRGGKQGMQKTNKTHCLSMHGREE